MRRNTKKRTTTKRKGIGEKRESKEWAGRKGDKVGILGEKEEGADPRGDQKKRASSHESLREGNVVWVPPQKTGIPTEGKRGSGQVGGKTCVLKVKIIVRKNTYPAAPPGADDFCESQESGTGLSRWRERDHTSGWEQSCGRKGNPQFWRGERQGVEKAARGGDRPIGTAKTLQKRPSVENCR